MREEINSKLFNYFLTRGKNKVTRHLYSYLCRKNPIIRTEVNNQQLFLPFSHMLPFYQKWFENYDRQLGRICGVIAEKRNSLSVIDVGANIGDTIINIGIKNGKYLAIEGEESFFEILRKNVKEYSVSIENIYLTDNENDQTYSSVVGHGTANIVKDGRNSNISLMTLSNLMKTKYRDFHADLLKVDTDGFDFKVILGGEEYIKAEKPLIYFEWCKEYLNLQGEDEVSIFPYLRNLGYEKLLLYDNFGNIMTMLSTDETESLKLLNEYSERGGENRRIFYYDVLVIPKESDFTYKDFLF